MDKKERKDNYKAVHINDLVTIKEPPGLDSLTLYKEVQGIFFEEEERKFLFEDFINGSFSHRLNKKDLKMIENIGIKIMPYEIFKEYTSVNPIFRASVHTLELDGDFNEDDSDEEK